MRKTIYNSTEENAPITGFKTCHVRMFLQEIVLTGRMDSTAVEKFKD